MQMRQRIYRTLPAVLLGLTAGPALAQLAQDPAAETAIVKQAEAFASAFSQADAKALAAFWTPDGDYVDQTGHRFSGRASIEKEFADLFAANKGLLLRIEMESLKMVAPDVVIEDGTTAVIPPNGSPPSRTRYTIVHVKQNGEWLLDSVREAAFAPPSQYEHLRVLEWLIGEWEDESDSGESALVSLDWADNQNFIVSSFAMTVNGISVSSGSQWIGWDSSQKMIRSWTFESNGSFGEGSWTASGDKVTIKSTSVLQDGRKASATEIVTRVDANTLTWESRERLVDGEALPDIAKITMKRSS